MWRGRKDKRESLLFGRSISFQSEKVRWKEVGSRSSISFFGEEMNRFRFATQRTPFRSHIKDRSWWFVSGNWSRFFFGFQAWLITRAYLCKRCRLQHATVDSQHIQRDNITDIQKVFHEIWPENRKFQRELHNPKSAVDSTKHFN